eukprot:Sspe_Gene.24363::Locus_9649_Transcript_1_1_Confidence_1.000_Length_464::g.24363::m.24363
MEGSPRRGGGVSVLECCVCLERFRSEGDGVPCVLSCGHTLCLGDTVKMRSGESLECPTCRGVTTVRGDAPPKNFMLIEALRREGAEGCRTSRGEVRECMECGREATVSCENCARGAGDGGEALLCAECFA